MRQKKYLLLKLQKSAEGIKSAKEAEEIAKNLFR